MLRLYKPIQHDIFKLQTMLKQLVCNVWCGANANDCESKLDADFKVLYQKYDWLKLKVDKIYIKCKKLSSDERKAIKDAFETNNKIEELCNGTIIPTYLNQLNSVVENLMKPLLVDFYEDLLKKAKVPGTKKDYYEKLVEENEFKDCPCCGLIYFEPKDSDNREAFDHYLPKSIYPFSSVNFQNLVPLCYKCNSDRKGKKDPIENGKKAFYPFSNITHEVEINISIDHSKDLRRLERTDLKVEFKGDKQKLDSWDRLFAINDRYNDTSRDILKRMLRMIKRRHIDFQGNNTNWIYSDSLDKLIEDYKNDKYDEKKFLKIPLMIELKNCSSLIDVYGN
jgi:hypothetical protein